jgi:hypothetical protein
MLLRLVLRTQPDSGNAIGTAKDGAGTEGGL